MTVKQLNIATGDYEFIFNVDPASSSPSFTDLNGCDINPIDNTAYGTVIIGDDKYLIKFGPIGGGQSEVKVVASIEGKPWSGAFDNDGNFWGSRNEVFWKISNVANLPEYSMADRDLAGSGDWATVVEFDTAIKHKDIAYFNYNLAGAADGSTQQYLAGLGWKDVNEVQLYNIDADEKYVITVTGKPPRQNNAQNPYGAAWTFKDSSGNEHVSEPNSDGL